MDSEVDGKRAHEHAIPNSDDSNDAAPKVSVTTEITSVVSFAGYQNAIPLLRNLSIANNSRENLENLELIIESHPAFIRRKIWKIERILSGGIHELTDRRIDLDPQYLAGLNEAERGELRISVQQSGEPLCEHSISIRVLARDEWGGVSETARLLPAFVMPNDPGVSKVLRTAVNLLENSGKPGGLNGYQGNDPARVLHLIQAIYLSISQLGLGYSEPPSSFEKHGQKIRSPSRIMSDGLSTCLDTSLFLAAAFESAGLKPVVIMLEGHAFVGVWRISKGLPSAIEHDVIEVRKAVNANELILLESTCLTQNPPSSIKDAIARAKERIAEDREHEFSVAIDVSKLRSAGILPLASHQQSESQSEIFARSPSESTLDKDEIEIPLPEEVVEEKPKSPEGRIDRWQQKLLDLTLRNRLLNFADTRSGVPFVCGDVSYLEDRLAADTKVRLISLPDQAPLGDRDPELLREMRNKDVQRTFAADALKRDELASNLTKSELESRLIKLHRQVKSDMAEGGTNTLFLAVGFLRWKKKPEDDRSFRAPLLLVPVRLERRSATSQFHLSAEEDETHFNETLLQFLKKDFDLDLAHMSELPIDDSGIDVQNVLKRMAHEVRHVGGFEVVNETALSTFSFVKYLMWKDLVDRTDQLRQNRVVKHLIDSPEEVFAGASETFPDEQELDNQYRPDQIVTLLDCDSSQMSAAIAAAEGRDFVLVGPPGTGKSQTITNMIANCLAAGKTVLFVAEKTAALEVVYRRLRENGLGDHCLELHSRKTDRKHFLGQLYKSWECGKATKTDDWGNANGRLQQKRDELNSYAGALHRTHSNGWNAYKAIGIAALGDQKATPDVTWSNANIHDEKAYLKLEETVEELASTFSGVEHKPALAIVDHPEWSNRWEAELIEKSSHLRNSASNLSNILVVLKKALSVEETKDGSLNEIVQLSRLATKIITQQPLDNELVAHTEYERIRGSFINLHSSITAYQEEHANLSVSYPKETINKIPVDQLDFEWRQAVSAIWPASIIKQRRTKRLLSTYANGNQVDPENDLPILRRLQLNEDAVASNPIAQAELQSFEGLETDIANLQGSLKRVDEIRSVVRQIAKSEEEVDSALNRLRSLLSNENTRHTLQEAARAYTSRYEEFVRSWKDFGDTAGVSPVRKDSKSVLSDVTQSVGNLLAVRDLIKNWTLWCEVRNKASGLGLEPIIGALENREIDPEDLLERFRLAYARWWLPQKIDEDPVLRNFAAFKHENTIQQFRELDEDVKHLARARVLQTIEHGLQTPTEVSRNSELGKLRHQAGLQRPSQTIRSMIGGMTDSFSKLAPCVLMSPLSIAQYLPTSHQTFDVVIFDEASQITTWDAVGAIARGNQTIIVGDPKQLPPTNFFGRSEVEVEADDPEFHLADLESILDEAKASGLPVRNLRWHYRSRHESLIAFSNWHYYGNRLITFPSPASEDVGVKLRHVPDGIYGRGRGEDQTNPEEARVLVEEVTSRLTEWLKLPEEKRPSLGIVTFNSHQQSRIQDLLDDMRRTDPELEWYFSEDRYEPVIVKNLENIQGDERDVMYFSITYGRDAAGKLPMSFGALNKAGGERRLNVAVTRAREELVVCSSIKAEDIDLSRSKALATQHLKTFLDYADRGSIALPATDTGSQGGFDSPFEAAVAEALEARGWQVVTQVGVSGFRVDLGIRHPDRPGIYLAGVECDGATYHSSATARDRDKVREQILRNLGWEIFRIWSTDWYFNSAKYAEKLHEGLNALLGEKTQEKDD